MEKTVTELLRLTSEELKVSIGSLNALMDIELSEMSLDEQELIKKYLSEMKLFNPYFILRPDAIELIVDKTFSSIVIRNFMMNLTYKYFILVPSTNDHDSRLALALMDGIIIDGFNYCVLPESIASSCANHLFTPNKAKKSFFARLFQVSPEEAVFNSLQQNKFLMVLLLTQLITTE